MASKSDFAAVLNLMKTSDRHKTWSRSDVERLIIPPIELKQYMVFRDEERPVGYLSWAWMSQEASDGFASRERKLTASDWNSGPHAWIIDVISDGGNVRKMMGALSARFPGQRAQFTRSSRSSKVHHAVGQGPKS